MLDKEILQKIVDDKDLNPSRKGHVILELLNYDIENKLDHVDIHDKDGKFIKTYFYGR